MILSFRIEKFVRKLRMLMWVRGILNSGVSFSIPHLGGNGRQKVDFSNKGYLNQHCVCGMYALSYKQRVGVIICLCPNFSSSLDWSLEMGSIKDLDRTYDAVLSLSCHLYILSLGYHGTSRGSSHPIYGCQSWLVLASIWCMKWLLAQDSVWPRYRPCQAVSY